MQTLANVARLVLRPNRLPRLELIRTYISLLIRSAQRSAGPGVVRFLGHALHYQDVRDALVVFEEIFLYGFYNVEMDAPGHRPYVIEGGANLGFAIAYIKSLWPDATITAFEAEPRTAALLSRTIRDSGWKDVTLHAAALWSCETELRFGTFAGHAGSPVASVFNYVSGHPYTEYVSVPAVPLSRFIDRTVDLLILDIEGAEYEVMDELIASGKLSSVRQMVIEIHHDHDSNANAFGRLTGLLSANGFAWRIHATAIPFRPGKLQNYMLYVWNLNAARQIAAAPKA